MVMESRCQTSFSNIEKIGNRRVLRCFHGPGKVGRGRAGRWEQFDMNDFNVPSPSVEILKNPSSYTVRSGIIRDFLAGLLKVATNNSITTLVSNGSVIVIPVLHSHDGMGLKPGCKYDPLTKELVGTVDKIDVAFVKNHPKPKPQELRPKFIREANVSVLTSVDNKLTLPIGVDYSPAKGTGEAVLNFAEQRLKQVQVCFNCFAKIDTEYSIIKGDGSTCTSASCLDCLDSNLVCNLCSAKGHENVELLL